MILESLLGAAVGIILGFVFQKGRFQMNAAFKAVVSLHDHPVLRSWLVVLIINMILVNLMRDTGIITVEPIPFRWAAIAIGGFLFGVGVVYARGCTCGTWYGAGSGRADSGIALIGFIAGASAVSAGFLRPALRGLERFTADLDAAGPVLRIILLRTPVSRWAVIAVFTVLVIVLFLRNRYAEPEGVVISRRVNERTWRWLPTGIAIGAVTSLVWLFTRIFERPYGLSLTGPTVSWVRLVLTGDPSVLSWASFTVILIPLGAYLAARTQGRIRYSLPPARIGLIRFAGGCNVGPGITGLGILAVSSIEATAAALLGVLVGERLPLEKYKR